MRFSSSRRATSRTLVPIATETIAVVISFNTFGGNTRDIQVPDVRGQVSADAIAVLQNRGFKPRTLQKPDSTM